MTSSYLTFDTRYDLTIHCIQRLSTVHALVPILGLYYDENRSYTFFNDRGLIAGRLNKHHSNVKVKLSMKHVISLFSK